MTKSSDLPDHACQNPDFEITKIPSAFDKHGEPVFIKDSWPKKANISCLVCHAQWLRTEEPKGVFSFRAYEADAMEFLQHVHAKSLKKDDYIPDVPTQAEYEKRMMDELTQYEKDLIILSDAWKKRELSDDEFSILMRERWPNVPREKLYEDMEQYMDPEGKRGIAGQYYFYFPRKK